MMTIRISTVMQIESLRGADQILWAPDMGMVTMMTGMRDHTGRQLILPMGTEPPLVTANAVVFVVSLLFLPRQLARCIQQH